MPTPQIHDENWTPQRVVDAIPNGSDLKAASYDAQITNGDETTTEKRASPLPFFHLLERLKTTQREGWRRFGISR